MTISKRDLLDVLKNVATKDDLKAFATKDDLKAELSQYATKDDLDKKVDEAVNVLRILIEDNSTKIELLAESNQTKVDQIERNRLDILNLNTRVTTLEDVVKFDHK